MSVITDLYLQLFGKDHLKDGDVISFSEHGRAGGVNTGQAFKFTKDVDEQIIIDETTSGTTYIGTASIGAATSAASWQIVKLTEASLITQTTYADGDDNYDNIWDNRDSLSYS